MQPVGLGQAGDGLSEDPGPHAVFFPVCEGLEGGGIQGVTVVVVVVATGLYSNTPTRYQTFAYFPPSPPA